MKKILSLFLIIVLIASLFTGCFGKTASAFEEEMAQGLQNIYNELIAKLPDASDVEKQKAYLIKWAGVRNIPVSYDKNNNIIMSKKGTAGYENAPNTVLQCNIGVGDATTQYEPIATALYLLENV